MTRLAIALGLAATVVVLLALLIPSRPAGRSRFPAPRRPPAPTPAAPEESATRFLLSLSLPVMLAPDRRDAVIARYAAPAALATLRDTYASEAARLRAALTERPRVARTALLGYRRVRRSLGGTAVDIWAVTLGGSGASPVSVGWRLLRVTLTRTQSTWRIRSVQERPAPPMDGSARSLAGVAGDFEDYHVAP